MTIIAGSRTITNLSVVVDVIATSGFTITRVLQGEAKGVDSLAKKWAIARGIPVDPFIPDWDNLKPVDDLGIHPYPKKNKWGRWYDDRAGVRRNEQMALAELSVDGQLIAIIQKGYKSNGTWDMITRAEAHGLKVFRKEV